MEKNKLLDVEKDVCGRALYDYYKGESSEDLIINTSYGDIEEMPVEVFFRDFEDFPLLEAIALEHCYGKVLDVGAGTGCHSLILQDKGLDVFPIEVSPYCVKIMQDRGIENVKHIDFFNISNQKFDTLLLMMNGLGLVEKVQYLPFFLKHCASLLKPKGQILLDSSNVNYLIEEFNLETTSSYIGEIAYQYIYMGTKGPWFNWLYLEKELLSAIASDNAWNFELIYDDKKDHYLASLTLK